ncbi:hypothetical protein BS47DRAFT_824527 [Hydnum rufescens UP504]|uniref:Uncharacterized protein n=1 Tax=Hydnum rufescens UP504 TaxID=1448309 RepID=A0A9P6B033_9AGAM|nr:hypothetical protein BS47DRAFT_824527 [Hydnum rufescens UP504]
MVGVEKRGENYWGFRPSNLVQYYMDTLPCDSLPLRGYISSIALGQVFWCFVGLVVWMPSCSSEIPILSTSELPLNHLSSCLSMLLSDTGAGSSGMDAGIGDGEEDIISTTIICNRREL